MKNVLCRNGHFFDEEKNQVCPVCGKTALTIQENLSYLEEEGVVLSDSGRSSDDSDGTILLDTLDGEGTVLLTGDDATGDGTILLTGDDVSGDTVLLEQEPFSHRPSIGLPQRPLGEADPCCCYYCFSYYPNPIKICDNCGKPWTNEPKLPIQLYPGTTLQNGRYIVGLAVGQGGFGVVYHVYDTNLQREVAIKEYYPRQIVNRSPGTKAVPIPISEKNRKRFEFFQTRFLAEARTMARFKDHANIPHVIDFFEENNTNYFVMEYLKGVSLKDYILLNNGQVDQDTAMQVVEGICNALSALHSGHVIHRDVAPDNVFLCAGEDKVTVKLMDLGNAILSDRTDEMVEPVLKPGYSPAEQYDKTGKMGPWTDIYALGATLYVMFTGIRPEESTNRKIVDKVVPPCEINPNISQNLSDAIMRAMAVVPHLRYQTVKEFMEAIRGERKVVSVEDYKKRRNRRRIIGIVAGVAVVVLAFVFSGVFYRQRQATEGLLPAEFEIWFSVKEGSGESAAMEDIAEEFMASFEGVTVHLKAIPEEEYEEAIQQAADTGRLPDLFESSGLDDSLLARAADLKTILNSEQAAGCYFLNQYDRYYTDTKQIPLGVEVPMAWVVTRGKVQLNFEKDSFRDVAELYGEDETPPAVDERCQALLNKNFTIQTPSPRSAFLNKDFEAMTTPVLLTSTMYISEVRSTITGVEKRFVYPDTSSVYCSFVYEWSVGNGDAQQQNAAKRFIEWMLGEAFQNTLMITINSEGQIPLCKTSYEEICSRIQYLSPLLEMRREMKFER